MAHRLTEKELQEVLKQYPCWKYMKLWYWAHDYEEAALAWADAFPPVVGEKRTYIQKYFEVYDALTTLEHEPCAWVCDAITNRMRKSAAEMNELLVSIDESEGNA